MPVGEPSLEDDPTRAEAKALHARVVFVRHGGDEATLDQFPERPMERLLRHLENAEEIADPDAGDAANPVEDPMVHAPKPLAGEEPVRLLDEPAVAEEHQLDRLVERREARRVIRFVFSNESCERLSGMSARVRRALNASG